MMSPFRIALIAGGSAFMAAWITAATTAGQADRAVVTAGRDTRVTAPVVAGPDPVVVGLAAEVGRLRERLGRAPVPQESVRNPFSLAPPPPRPSPPALAALAAPPTAATAPRISGGPDLVLVGIAETATADGPRRTAILTAPDDAVLLVEVGDPLPGGYRVEEITGEAVRLGDGRGAHHRLALP